VPAPAFKTNTDRYDPYKNYRFKVKIGNDYVMACNKVSALKRTTKAVDFRAGGDPSVVRKSRGQTSYEAITLEATTCAIAISCTIGGASPTPSRARAG
jgi:hypothetical protein